MDVQSVVFGEWAAALDRQWEVVDQLEAWAAAEPRAEIDSLSRRLVGSSLDDVMIPTPLDANAFLADPAMRKAAFDMMRSMGILQEVRDYFREETSVLLEHVEGALEQ